MVLALCLGRGPLGREARDLHGNDRRVHGRGSVIVRYRNPASDLERRAVLVAVAYAHPVYQHRTSRSEAYVSTGHRAARA
eukprot:3616353-Rhodomonas_salina.2